jgi:mono/diheme cytochrome c family protein
MWKSSGREDAATRRHGDTATLAKHPRVSLSPCLRVFRGRSRPLCLYFFLFTFSFLLPACRRDMQDQPKAKPYRSSSFFKDGLASRPPVTGTVARGWLREDKELFTGKKAGSGATNQQTAANATTPGATASAAQVAAAYPDDVDKFPFPITGKILDRGQERFNIFCAVCHGATGEADGMIVRRGFRKPPSYHEDRLREAPVGHFFDAVTNGWGAMPSYASQVPVEDRWAIIAYIRALQLSHAQNKPAASANGGGK